MTTRELATQLVRDAMHIRSGKADMRSSYEISQRLEEASAALERLAAVEDHYERQVKP